MIDAAQYGQHPHASHIPASRAAERCLSLPGMWTASRPYNAAAGVALRADVEAYLNEGRWIAECPDCHGAQLTAESDPRFMCVNCGNAAVDGQWRRVAWPQDRGAIEAHLEHRPTVNRHWLPGESVADLAAENVARGLPARGR